MAAIRLADQAQFDPSDVIVALRDELLEGGGSVVEGVRVTGVSSGTPLVVTTTHGQVEARCLVLATGIPILDRGLYFAKLRPHRSYVLAYSVPGGPAAVPEGMYLSVDNPGRSLRSAPHEQDELLLVGGNSHPVGRHPSPASLVQELDAWTGSTRCARTCTASCRTAGAYRMVTMVCPHLHGIVAWNDAEQTWDCPLHGSRFTADGHLLEGPGTQDLRSR